MNAVALRCPQCGASLPAPTGFKATVEKLKPQLVKLGG